MPAGIGILHRTPRVGTPMTASPRLRLCALALSLTLVSSAALGKSKHPRHLKPVTSPILYTLAEPVSAEGYNITYTVKAGTYTLRYRDKKGAYLLGEGQCLHVYIHSPKSTGRADVECGVYLPDDPKRGAEFFRLRATAQHFPEMGPLVNWIIRSGNGSFDWYDVVQSLPLREGLKPTPSPASTPDPASAPSSAPSSTQ